MTTRITFEVTGAAGESPTVDVPDDAAIALRGVLTQPDRR